MFYVLHAVFDFLCLSIFSSLMSSHKAKAKAVTMSIFRGILKAMSRIHP